MFSTYLPDRMLMLQINIYDGEIGKLALEMSPLFVRYCTNTHHTCELVYC